MSGLNKRLLKSVVVALSQNSDALNLGNIKGVDVTAAITSANPSNKVFAPGAVDATANTVASTAHGFTTGMLCTLTTVTTLPGGLSLATNYYIIVVDANTFKFATSQANALAGTAIDITDQGTGNHTVVVTATLAGTIKLQKNNAPSNYTPNWFDITNSSQVISAAGNLNWTIDNANFSELRAVAAMTSGTVIVDIDITAKG